MDHSATTHFFVFLSHSYCGIKDPSWAEIGHFVNFLEIQLRLCEKSVFCNQQLVGDVLTGFKNFVVKFMMRMSRVSVFFGNNTYMAMSSTLLTHIYV